MQRTGLKRLKHIESTCIICFIIIGLLLPVLGLTSVLMLKRHYHRNFIVCFISQIRSAKFITKLLRSHTKCTFNNELVKEQQMVYLVFGDVSQTSRKEIEKVCSNFSICVCVNQHYTPLYVNAMAEQLFTKPDNRPFYSCLLYLGFMKQVQSAVRLSLQLQRKMLFKKIRLKKKFCCFNDSVVQEIIKGRLSYLNNNGNQHPPKKCLFISQI